MSPRVRTLVYAGASVALGALMVWLYLRYVWFAGPTLTWARHGTDYELLAPRMLGIALLAPYFLWVIGRSLADLPQRVTQVLRQVFDPDPAPRFTSLFLD